MALPERVWSSDKNFNSILASIMVGDMFVFLGIDSDENGNPFLAVAMFVNIIGDGPTGAKVVQVYAFYDLTSMRPSDNVFREAFEVLFNLGRQTGCGKIIAITKCPRVVEACENMGGIQESLLTWDIPVEVNPETILEGVQSNGNV